MVQLLLNGSSKSSKYAFYFMNFANYVIDDAKKENAPKELKELGVKMTEFMRNLTKQDQIGCAVVLARVN